MRMRAFRFSISPPQLKHHRGRFSAASTGSYPPLLNHRYWSGLPCWRRSPINKDRYWGPNGPIQEPSEVQVIPADIGSCSSLAEMGSVVISTADPLAKAKLSHLAYSKWRQEGLPVGVSDAPSSPARPPKPQLVSPKEIPSPKNSGLPLNAYMLHNLAHVELNAIDLAWDTVVRFSPYTELLGEGFFADFAHVADDESRHFTWCSQRLGELGFRYGDMPAHSFLWRECEKSSGNVSARLAVIPLVQEARGLDAGPRLVNKLIGFGDQRTSNIVAKIADEEVAHVAVGVYWFVFVCQKMGRKPDSTFGGNLFPHFSCCEQVRNSFLLHILKEYKVELKGPFNYSAREEAGIPREWYDSSTSTVRQENKLSETCMHCFYGTRKFKYGKVYLNDCYAVEMHCYEEDLCYSQYLHPRLLQLIESNQLSEAPQMGVQEIPLKGIQYTWANNRAGEGYVEEVHDRMFVSYNWLVRFPNAEVFRWFRSASDHCMLVINSGGVQIRHKRRFNFDKRWI
ncbi:2-nonaprenyl-3-methyl-6-methoxy-1,4-benzoquinol hydroxylase [Striga asiatica]|uniref:2-nonaprenyl-3-methyl-6-methoxy-1,4-benzoquinol hydroxylase n=1 Tax=Striga asiatica TaxID=4170 RepID=A0A5A7RGZ9_STRAF|nr:2-nonaprenyl-3-methyl-6-methoxy-1,4-benzoquinol hydroxylase [Striga asiatica]